MNFLSSFLRHNVLEYMKNNLLGGCSSTMWNSRSYSGLWESTCGHKHTKMFCHCRFLYLSSFMFSSLDVANHLQPFPYFLFPPLPSLFRIVFKCSLFTLFWSEPVIAHSVTSLCSLRVWKVSISSLPLLPWHVSDPYNNTFLDITLTNLFLISDSYCSKCNFRFKFS